MKKIIKFLVVPVLILAMLFSMCFISPIAVFADNYIAKDWTARNSSKCFVNDGDLVYGYNITTQGDFVRYNNTLKPLQGVTFKVNCAVGEWYAVIFEVNNTGAIGEGAASYKKQVFLFWPQKNGSVTIQHFNGTAPDTSYTINNFDMSVEHTYHYRKDSDAYRFCVDGVAVCQGAAITTNNTAMNNAETNGGYFSVGSSGAVNFTGLRVKGYEWITSGTNNADGNLTDGYNLSTGAGKYATLNKQIDIGSGISFQYMPASSNWEAAYLSFSATNDVLSMKKGPTSFLLKAYNIVDGVGKLSVSAYNTGDVSIGSIDNFDFTKEHTYRLVKREDGNTYLFRIDNKVFWDYTITDAQFNAANNNWAGGYITLGGNVASSYTNIKPALWSLDTSAKASGTLEDGYTVEIKKKSKSYARLNKKIDLTKGISFKFTPSGTYIQMTFTSNPVTPFGLSSSYKTGFLLHGSGINSETGIGTLKVCRYFNSEEIQINSISSFDFNAEHVFKMKADPNNTSKYYLAIDDQICWGNDKYITLSEMNALNNNGEGGYVSFSSDRAAATFNNVKPVSTETNPWTALNYTSDENGYDFTTSSAVRYNKVVDMKKGIVLKLSHSGDWAGISFEGTAKDSFGTLASTGDKKSYLMRIKDTTIGTSIMDDSGNESGYMATSAIKGEYIHIQYTQYNNEGNYYLTINGLKTVTADSISPTTWESRYNNGYVYVSFTPNSSLTVADFKEYTSEPTIDTSVYEVEDDILYGVMAGTEVSDLAVYGKNGEIRVFKDGTQVTEGKISTGMTVASYLNTYNKSNDYIISVAGDVDCDGAVSATDITYVRKHLMDVPLELTDAQSKALNANCDEGIDIRDLVSIKKISIGLSSGKNFFPEAYGAVGDGVTDDTVAINATIRKACLYSEKTGAPYVISFSKSSYAINSQIKIQNVENVTLQGSNTELIGSPSGYMQISGSENIKVSGLNFNYDTPVACRAKVTNREVVDVSEGLSSKKRIITFEVPEWYIDAVENNILATDSFAIPANERRDHSYIDSIEKIDSTHVKVIFKDKSPNGWSIMRTESELPSALNTDYRCTNYVDLPTPGYSHSGNAIQLINNKGEIELENCNIWNASQFVFQITNNSGNIKLTNTNVTPKNSEACPTVAWRDVVHAKDNRGALIVTDCNFGGTHDDIFNISATMCRVDEIENGTSLTLYGLDYGGNFVDIKVGDTLVAINPATDKYYGEATVISADVLNIVIDKDLGIEQGAYVYFKELAAPGSTINGGEFNGTVRIRASGTTITDAKFTVLQMWTAYEGNNGPWEGPIPENITYKNCEFVNANNERYKRITFECKKLDGTKAENYAVDNIVFDGCTFENDNMIDRDNAGVIIR